MPEIDPQSEARLAGALRRLAASSHQSAPPEIGAGLLSEFRRHHARRRRIRRTGIAALAACLALAAGLVSLRRPAQNRSDSETLPAVATSSPEKAETPALPVHVAATPPRPVINRKASKTQTTKPVTNAANRQFLALPGYDPAVPLDQLHVVRVQLPASALWRIGAPISADAGAQRMTADFVVSQDGTPYAVRLVQ